MRIISECLLQQIQATSPSRPADDGTLVGVVVGALIGGMFSLFAVSVANRGADEMRRMDAILSIGLLRLTHVRDDIGRVVLCLQQILHRNELAPAKIFTAWGQLERAQEDNLLWREIHWRVSSSVPDLLPVVREAWDRYSQFDGEYGAYMLDLEKGRDRSPSLMHRLHSEAMASIQSVTLLARERLEREESKLRKSFE